MAENELQKNDSQLWLGIIDEKVVAREKSFKKLKEILEEKYPDKTSIITSQPSCETMIL